MKMEIGDIVLVKHGAKSIALTEVISKSIDIFKNQDVNEHLDWFRYRRQVKVLSFNDNTLGKFPYPRDTLKPAYNKNTKTYQYIDEWYKKLIDEKQCNISDYLDKDIKEKAAKENITIYNNSIQYKNIHKLFNLTSDNIKHVKIEIENVKNVKQLVFDFEFKKGLYTIVGENGIGKSSLLISLGRLINGNTLRYELKGDTFNDSIIKYTFNDKTKVVISGKSIEKIGHNRWQQTNKKMIENIQINEFPKIDGFFESSIISGTRFEQLDIKKAVLNFVDTFNRKKLVLDNINEDTNFIKEYLDKIMNSISSEKYNNLFIMKSNKWNEKDIYFLKNKKQLISEFSFSTGEYFVLSILKLIKQHISSNTKSLVVIDEIDISLHPKAQKRLIEVLKKFSNEFNLTIIIATHSLPIIDSTEGKNLYYTKNNNGIISFVNNKKAGLISSYLYDKIIFDRVILVEDKLALEFTELVIKKNVPNSSNFLYTIIPIGGWEKVLEIYKLNDSEKFFGTKVFVILDGDIESNKKYMSMDTTNINHTFLPIENIEQYIYETSIKETDFQDNIKKTYLKTTNFEDLNIELYEEYYFDLRNKFKKYIQPTSDKDKLTDNFNKFIQELEEFKENPIDLIKSKTIGDKKNCLSEAQDRNH